MPPTAEIYATKIAQAKGELAFARHELTRASPEQMARLKSQIAVTDAMLPVYIAFLRFLALAGVH